AHPPHRRDAVSAELVAQVAHVHVDDVRGRVEVVAPHAAQQLLPAQHLTRVPQELLREGELPGRQVDLHTPHYRPAGTKVEREVAVLEDGQLTRLTILQPHPDSREQFVEGE